HFSNTDVAGNLGTLHLTDSGAWTYDLDNTNPTVQALGKGATATDIITVQSADGTTHKVTITVNGTNDKAVIAGTDSGAVTEESQLQTSGTLSVTDVDTGEAHFSNTDIAGTLGTLHLTDSGAWTYDLDNTNPTVQALSKGATATDTITVQSADGTTHKVTITVNGTNDKAVIAGTDSGAVTEESQLQTSGTLTVTDVDTGEAHFSNTDIKGSLGTLHLTDSGAWTYDLDNSNPAVQALAKGQHAKDIITVHSTDGTPHQVAITVNGANDAAQITGTTTGAVTEDRIYGMQWLVVNSHMNVTDTDAGEAHFDPVLHAQNNAGIGYTSTLGASVVVTPDGDWHYQLNNNITQVQSLGQGQSYIDKVTVHTVDGTTQELQITITGTNDAPTVTGSRVLPAGTEDQTLRITQTQLLAGATDIDKNDAGTLHVDAVTADHGTVTHNADGSFTFHPDQDYNGQVQFTYDIKDAHGGSVQATASSTLAATADAATISGVDTGDVHEGHTFTAPDGSMTGGYVDDRSPDHMHGNIGKLWNDEIHTDGHLSIVDADAGESYAQTGVYYGSHGRVILQTNGDWSYFASIGQDATGRAIDHLGKGESLTDTVTVKSADGTTHDIVITIHGDNDRPYCSGEVQLNSGKEDLAQTITASELLANTVDVDTNDIGKLTITNLHADHGSILDNQDGTFTFTPTKDYNGQVHFTYDVQDAHGGVTHTGASTTLSAVGDAATIAGIDTGSISENTAGVDMSPDYAQPGIATLGNKPLYADGKLTITDPDVGEAEFEHQGSNGYDYHGTYGDLVLLTDGTWHYHADAGHRALIGGTTTTRGTAIDQLGEGQSLTDTITIHSKDGTTHDIVITIHGSNDRPYCSSEVVLQSGSEDTRQTLTTTQLLANTVDVDKNDAGLLSIGNLHADHGSILNNADGTFTFTPEKDYNGQVHFAYDVKDAHGGVTHTGASTTLAAVDDKTIISGVDHGVATEDVATVVYTNPHIMDAVDWQALQITDVDSPNTQVTVEFAGKQYTWNIGSDLDVTTPYGRFQFHTIASGPHQGEHSWSYIGDNNNVHVQELKHGESFTESIKLIATDGTEFPITVKVNGTEDGVIIDSNSELGHVVENAQTGASVSGNVVAHDVDLHDTVSWTQTPTGGISGQYGTFHLSADGQWHYDVDQSKATKLGDGDEYWEHFTVEAVSTDGSHVSKSVSVVVHGNNDVPTVSGEVSLPSGKEDTSIHITQAELIANATDVDTNDRGWLHVENLTADHGNLVSNSDGSFTFNPDPNYNGTVHFTYDVADRHGGIAHTGANTTLAAVNDASTLASASGSVTEDQLSSSSNVELSSGWQDIDVKDIDSVNDADVVTIEVNGIQHKVPADFAMTLSGHYGTFTTTHNSMTGQDKWIYTVDNTRADIQGLSTGDSLQDTMVLITADGTRLPVTATIHGADDHVIIDTPDATQAPLGTVIEDTKLTTSGTLLAHDLDSKDSTSFTASNMVGKYGTLSVNADGTWHYDLDPAKANVLSQGQRRADGFDITAISTDGSTTTKRVEVWVDGKDDAATIAGQDSGQVTEDTHLQTSGSLTVTDADTGEAHFSDTDIKGTLGTLRLKDNGDWTYDLDNNNPTVQALGANSTPIRDTVTVHSADGTQHQVVITINGTNDKPVLGVTQTTPTTGTLTETDVDVTDTHTFSVVSSTGHFGSLTVDPDTGDYVYTPNTSVAGMSYNAATNSYHGVDVFEVKVSDGQAEDSKFITFDASGHVTTSPTGGLVISTTVPQRPAVTAIQPTLPSGTNVAPTNTVTLDLASTSDSGSSNTDNLTNDTTPTITGHTDIPYSQVTVYDGSTPVGHVVSDASGQYSVAVSSLTEGDHNLSAKALAPSSVVPATSSLLSVHIDTQVHVGIQTDPVTADNVINAQESNSSINITGSVSGDFSVGDIVTLDVNGVQHTGAVDAKGHYSIAVPGSELIADADQKIEASIAVTDTAGNSAHATADVAYQVDTQVSVPTITFENAGADNLYSKAEIARGQANTITATVTPPGDAKIGEHLVVNGQDHVLDAHTLQHGIQIEIHPGSNVQATMTDEHGNTAGSQGFAASAIPEPIIVRPPSGSHQVSGTLGVPPLLPSLTPVPTAQSGWRIHLPNGQYVTSHQGQYGTLTIDPKTGHLHYQEQAQVHTGPHGSASGIGQHEDKFEVALQGTNQDEVVAHVNIQILSHGPGHSGKLTVGTEVVDMTITPVVHASHPAPPQQSDESHSSPETIEVTLYADDDSTHHDLMAGLSALADDHSATGSNPYTDIVGLHDAPKADDSAMPTPEPAPDLDLLLNQADDLAHQHPVDAFIDNNGEEHKPDDQHVLDEEHIQHDLPDVMDLPDHHH
ncbi:VCBS domain-containing protein, partial [Vibrio breoganii]